MNTSISRDDVALTQLYERVTAAIFAAEEAETSGDPGAAADAYLDVSFLEEEIAKLLPAVDPEGEIARRGAITAALSARQHFHAVALADGYLVLVPKARIFIKLGIGDEAHESRRRVEPGGAARTSAGCIEVRRLPA